MEEKSDQKCIFIDETKVQCLSPSTLLVVGELSGDTVTSYVNDLQRMAENFKLKAHFLEGEQECLLATLTCIKSADIKNRNGKFTLSCALVVFILF